MSNILMRNPRNAFLWLTVLWLSLCRITTVTSAPTAEQIAEKALAATVYMEMKDRNGKTVAFGSGFFVGQNRIATNFHVIKDAVKGTAKHVSKFKIYHINNMYATSATDKENDLALLKVTAFRGEPLPLGDSDTVKIGETVYVAGNPRGLEGTFSDGIISSIRGSSPRKLLQMTAPISRGSSGGPVLNSKGEVIGVSFATIEGGQNLNFAIPSNYLKSLMKRFAPAKAFPQRTARSQPTRSGARRELEPAKPFTQSNRTIAAGTYNKQGLAKYDLGAQGAAISDFGKAIHINSNFASAYYNRGRAKLLLGNTREAEQDFRTAMELAEKGGDENLKAKSSLVLRPIELKSQRLR